ncbi:TPA: hypothetical protein RQK93_003275 [Vibrio vulnificus]|nr:hypothetical protein [Vibrio vulnificus]
MNLFLVTSPLQLLCAIEAKHEYKTSSNILILRLEKSESSAQQMNLLLDQNDWDFIIFLGRKSKVWEARKLHYKLKKINPSLHFQCIFYADYSAWRTNVLLSNISIEKEVMFDDGIGTVREFYEKIQPNSIISRNKPSRDLLLKIVGLNPPRKIYPRENFSFFTFFKLPQSKHPVRVNSLSILQSRMDTKSRFRETGPIGFIGQGMVAEKGVNLEYYVSLLRTLIHENGVHMLYFPHRTEAEFVKNRLVQIEGLIYHNSKLPLELEISVEQITLSKIFGIASTASISLKQLYPTIPVIDLVIPVEHYQVREFGENFVNMAKKMDLDSIYLE